MSTTSKPGTAFTSEQDVQDWLETVVQSGDIRKHIQAEEKIGLELAHWSSPDFWPSFPVDYLTRSAISHMEPKQLQEDVHTRFPGLRTSQTFTKFETA